MAVYKPGGPERIGWLNATPVFIVFMSFLRPFRGASSARTVRSRCRFVDAMIALTSRVDGWISVAVRGGRNKLRLVLEAYGGVRREEY